MIPPDSGPIPSPPPDMPDVLRAAWDAMVTAGMDYHHAAAEMKNATRRSNVAFLLFLVAAGVNFGVAITCLVR